MMQLIELFLNDDWEIIFASSAAETSYITDLQKKGIKTQTIRINDSSFDEFVKDLQPEVVLYDRFITEEQFGWRVTKNVPKALQVLDSEDLHCLRCIRKKAVHNGKQFQPEMLLSEPDAHREIASIYRCDLTLVISSAEMELLQTVFNIDSELLHYLPFQVEAITKHTRQQWMPYEERNHFISIGNFRHPPNRDAVRYLKKTIWPLIRQQLPTAELHLYGAYPSAADNEMHNPAEGFFIEGRVADADDVVGQGRVMLAPLRFGAGLKGKLVQAMLNGTPSVTTAVGAEGLCGGMDWGGAITSNAVDFANAAVELYGNKKRWKEAQKNSTAIINERFSKNEAFQDLLPKIVRRWNNLSQHRRSNFIGGMLRHHTVNASKYLSKWIEEKNKD